MVAGADPATGRCDRIALEVAAATQQVGLRFDRRALESALKHVPHKPVAPLEVTDVGNQHAGHQPRELPGLSQLQEQMKVVERWTSKRWL